MLVGSIIDILAVGVSFAALTIYGQFIGVQYTDRITYNINYLVGEEIKTMVVIISFV